MGIADILLPILLVTWHFCSFIYIQFLLEVTMVILGFLLQCEVIRIFHYFALLVVPCLPHIPTFSTCPQHMDSIILLLNFHRMILFSQNISRVLMLCYVMPHLSVGQFKTGLHSHISSIFRLWVLLSCSV